MSDFHDNYPQYELMAHHTDEAGFAKRKKLWRVFWIMLGITVFELILGFNNTMFNEGLLRAVFIGLTVLKAYYIVYAFMHLGDEKSFMKWVIIAPFTGFILYLAIMVAIGEGSYSKQHRSVMDKQITEQKPSNAHEHSEAGKEGGEEHQEETHHE